MNRSYDRHTLRNTKSLNGLWDIIFDAEDCGIKKKYFSQFPESTSKIWVPSCWNFKSGRYNYEDIAWYRRKFNTSDSGSFYFTFEAISGSKKIWIDGELFTEHYGSFSDFSLMMNDLSVGQHEIVIRVDNRQDDYTMPRTPADWKNWGGIYRSVTVTKVQDVIIDRVFIDPIWNGYSVDKVSLRAKLIKSLNDKYDLPCSVYLDGKKILEKNIVLSSTSETIELGKIEVKDIELWSTDSPKLYEFRVVCGHDDLFERTGFRKVERSKGKLLINGKPMKIKGVNRHHSHDSHGFAITPDLTERDIDIVQDLNVNGIRGSHYPNESLVLDFCDERGILFVEEMPFWDHGAKSLGNSLFQERALGVLRDTIERDYNHPSIILWSLQNESGTDTKEGYELFGRMSKIARETDSNRLLTYSTNRPYQDICYEYIDVIGVNCYKGWYDGELEDWPSEIEKLKKHLKNQGQQDKPLVITEFGASAIFGERSFELDRKYSEEYQAILFKYIIDLLMKDEEIAGMYVWQFCDIRTSKFMEGRPKGYNLKGILNEHRKPKLAYDVVKNCFDRNACSK